MHTKDSHVVAARIRDEQEPTVVAQCDRPAGSEPVTGEALTGSRPLTAGIEVAAKAQAAIGTAHIHRDRFAGVRRVVVVGADEHRAGGWDVGGGKRCGRERADKQQDSRHGRDDAPEDRGHERFLRVGRGGGGPPRQAAR